MLDVFIGFIFICLGLYTFILAGSLPLPQWDYLGPSFLPKMFAFFLMILGFVMIIKSIIFLKHNKKNKKKRMNIVSTKAFISMMFFLIYALTLNFLGYIVSTFLFIFLFILYLDDKNRIWIALISSIVFTFLVYVIFTKIVYVNLPSGIFF